MKSYIGIDWSEKHHNVNICNELGASLAQFEIPHEADGFAYLVKQVQKVNANPDCCFVAIETSHNLLVDYLQEQGFQLYILAPSQVRSNRGRFSANHAKTDDSDAELLAEILRTDRGRLVRWQANGLLVQQITAKLSFVDDLTESIVQYVGRLRANLLRYYPQPLHMFSTLMGQVCLAWIAQYPDPVLAKAVSYEQFETFCLQHGYRRRRRLPEIYAQLHRQNLLDSPAHLAQIHQDQTVFLAQLIAKLTQQKKMLIKQVRMLFQQHPDHTIFASLPGAGDLLAPKLLTIFGDERQRFSSANMVQALAGTCPVTKKSGQKQSIHFRRACNHAWRQTAHAFAISSVRQSSWSAAYYAQALARNLSKNQAYRSLANRWLNIIWTLWQRRELYDEAYHLQQIHHRRQPIS